MTQNIADKYYGKIFISENQRNLRELKKGHQSYDFSYEIA